MINRISFAFFLAMSTLYGCDNAIKNKTLNDPDECTQYSCPMHPDKTSVSSAKCPECNMDMSPVIKNEIDTSKND